MAAAAACTQEAAPAGGVADEAASRESRRDRPPSIRGSPSGRPRAAAWPGAACHRPVAEDAENFRCGGGLLNYVQILYGKKGSQQKYGLEVPQMKKNT